MKGKMCFGVQTYFKQETVNACAGHMFGRCPVNRTCAKHVSVLRHVSSCIGVGHVGYGTQGLFGGVMLLRCVRFWALDLVHTHTHQIW